jgi:hypothetical protein
LQVVAHHRAMALGDTLIVLGPEHARAIAGDGWSKARVRQFLWERTRMPVRHLLPDADSGEGLPDAARAAYASPETDDTLLPKFRTPDNLKIIVAGGTAGRFTAIVPGWPFPNSPSALVIKRIAG